MTRLGRLAIVGVVAALALGCFSSGGSDGGSGGASATGGTGGGAPSGTGATSASGSGGTGTGGGTSVGTTGGAGGAAGAIAGVGGNACCPCPEQPQPAGCLTCDLYCPNDGGGTSGDGTQCGVERACASGEECCPAAGGSNYCVAAGMCVPAKCASPDTPIATPVGERPIAELHEGDLVLSVDHGVVVAVPIVATGRRAVTGHAVARVELDSGRVFEMSAGHPTADGRKLGAVAPGDALGDAHVASVSMIPYTYAFTYDIRPASDTGAYFAAGALVGSTLAVTDSGGER